MKEKIMRVRYEKLEDPKYLNEFWRVTSATSDIEFGVQGILTNYLCCRQMVSQPCFYLSVLGKLNFLIVLLLIADIYIVYLLREKASKYEVEISKEGITVWKASALPDECHGQPGLWKGFENLRPLQHFAGEADA